MKREGERWREGGGREKGRGGGNNRKWKMERRKEVKDRVERV